MLRKDRGGNITKPCRNSVIRKHFGPIPVTAQSEAYVCSCLLAGIAGSNPAGGMDVVRILRRQVEVSGVGPITRLEESYRVRSV